MKKQYSYKKKILEIPHLMPGDIIFIYKDNDIGKKIVEWEPMPKEFHCNGKVYIYNNKNQIPFAKKFSHVAIAQHDGLFLETGMYTGAIQTTIEKLLNSDIICWEVYRHKDFKNLIISYKKFYDKLGKDLDTLYNTDFLRKQERESFFCSQLVSKILKNYNLLDIEHTNLGPNALYTYIRLCKNNWMDVSKEYKDILYKDEYKERKTDLISRASSMVSTDLKIRSGKRMQDMAAASIDINEHLFKTLQPDSPTNRIDTSVTIPGFIANAYSRYAKEKGRKENTLADSVINLEAERKKENDMYALLMEYIEVVKLFTSIVEK